MPDSRVDLLSRIAPQALDQQITTFQLLEQSTCGPMMLDAAGLYLRTAAQKRASSNTVARVVIGCLEIHLSLESDAWHLSVSECREDSGAAIPPTAALAARLATLILKTKQPIRELAVRYGLNAHQPLVAHVIVPIEE